MSAFLEGLGKIFGKIADQFQGRIERTKNKITALEKEKNEILSKPATIQSSNRVLDIDDELVRLRDILKSSAKD